jgi:hypothetical protein
LVETLDQAEFRAFVAERERQGDLSHYELLNGRVVTDPPAGYPHERALGRSVPAGRG